MLTGFYYSMKLYQYGEHIYYLFLLGTIHTLKATGMMEMDVFD